MHTGAACYLVVSTRNKLSGFGTFRLPLKKVADSHDIWAAAEMELGPSWDRGRVLRLREVLLSRGFLSLELP